jgi:uncharacterized damage-inducible protein DinB
MGDERDTCTWFTLVFSVLTLPRAEDMPTLGTLRERWREEDVQHVAQYTNTRGQVYAAPLLQMMGHLVNHGTQYRCLAAVLLSRLGHSPGDLDVLIFLLE